jgi:hypothetical protein
MATAASSARRLRRAGRSTGARAPQLELAAPPGSDTLTGQDAACLDPAWTVPRPRSSPTPKPGRAAPTCFLCLSTAEAAAFEPPAGAVVVDLSGAHRLTDPALAAAWYDTAPGAWSYGLPELYPPSGRLIANPAAMPPRRCSPLARSPG